jgi:pre-mRNA-processing factor 19
MHAWSSSWSLPAALCRGLSDLDQCTQLVHSLTSPHTLHQVFEKSLVLKIIKEIGLCPVTNEPLSLDDLIDVKVSSTVPAVKPDAAGSIPQLLAALQSEYDANALEMYSLRKTLHETRQELSESLYQLDAATRVVARVVRERDEFRRLAEEGGSGNGAAETKAGREKKNTHNEPAKKKAKTGGGLPGEVRLIVDEMMFSPTGGCVGRRDRMSTPPEGRSLSPDCTPYAQLTTSKLVTLWTQISEDLLSTSKSLMSSRKKREISASLASVDDIRRYALKGSYAPHDKRKGGGGILALARYPHAGANAVLTAGADGVAHVVDTVSGETLATLKEGGHTKNITSIASLGAASKCLTASSVDGTVRLWDVEHSSCVSTIKHAGVLSIHMHPSGGFSKYLYSSTPSAWCMHDLGGGSESCLVSIGNESVGGSPFTTGALHPDGLVYATGAENGVVTLWESRSQSLAGTVSAEGAPFISSIAFSENGYHMASADAEGVKVWDLRKLSCIHTLDVPKAGSVAYDASGLFLGVGSATAAEVYGVKQKYENLAAFDDLPKKGAHSVVFGVDAKSIIVGASDLRVYGCPE